MFFAGVGRRTAAGVAADARGRLTGRLAPATRCGADLGPCAASSRRPGAGRGGLRHASAAGNRVKPYIAPGNCQPVAASLGRAQCEPSSRRRIANQLAGVQVLFNGIPSPLVYASQGQVNALVPYEIDGNSNASVQVTTVGGNSPAVSLYVRPAQPEVFNSKGAALALNQDSTINSPENPGSVRSSASSPAAQGA